ncbi:MAG: hypothetical protein KDC07_09605, partial [Chitinophagaceae bacterium]|nr:hypothetical protein [Chitinophagaceae bacterium]
LPRKGGDIDEQAEMLKYKMQKVYEVRYNESSGRLELFKEGQPAMIDNNKPVTDEDFAREWAERTGILMRDTRHILPSDVGTESWSVLNATDTEQPGMNAIEAWAEG